MKRNPSIELYRCLMMFGIVFIHCAYNSVGGMSWQNCIGKWCVDGFVLITGYFGTTFSIKKILRLYGIVMACQIVSRLSSCALTGGDFAFSIIVKECWEGMLSAWFVHAYVLMLCIAPLINAALSNKDGMKLVMPFIAMTLLWGLASELPYAHKILPKTDGIGSYTGLTLSAVYAIGRIVRLRSLECRFATWKLLLALPLLLMVDAFQVPHHGQWIGGWFGSYASPFAVATAFVVFSLFARLELSGRFASLVLFVAPSMFPVYLMHWNGYTYHVMHDVGLDLMQSCPVVLVCLAIAIPLYVGTVILDLPRRLVSIGLRHIFR